MITNTLRHLAWCGVLSVALVFPSMAQTSGKTMSQSSEATSQQTQNTLTPEEKRFLDKAMIDNMAQIEMGRMAQQKSQNDQIRQFGQTLVTDHQNAQDKLQKLAEQYNVTLPSSLDQRHRAEANRLSGLAGAQFDRQFLQTQVTDQQNAMQKFKNMSENAKDQAVKQYASNTVTVLQKHVNTAQNLQQHMTPTSQMQPKGGNAQGSAGANKAGNSSQDAERSKPGTQNPTQNR